ncbi:ATPase involved in DNA repair [Paramagnetospirillum magnetotacticum MS-1]|uniref:ATPase involved in DNA repair n=2 Tax=Paramagnetospirillum magnetotacticum TaxID=188 RepID=A0A0C2YXE3_PARME|nr:ATPase involved in DNA repair [Paramagnetospirillum magnetotacticum MS-1]
MKEHKEAGRLGNVILLIPNIEFRISPKTARGNAVNIHLLISPDDPDHVDRIENALSYLVFEGAFEDKFKCLPADLAKLGRETGGADLDQEAAIRAGANVFKIEFDVFKKWFEGQRWLRENSIVAVAAGNDGLSGLRKDDGWKAVHDKLSHFVHALFTATPSDLKFWLGKTGKKAADDILRRYGGPKPCIHGCDAHDFGRLFEPDEQRYCWIKADPTFEGLRQILFEPAERVHIGPSSPEIALSKANLISSITIADSDGWFPEATIPVNPGLVTIIGKKGSGKSALAEIVAVAAEQPPSKNDPRSFLKRAKGHLKSATATVKWADGSETKQVLQAANGFSEPRVRYLSQSFVEELCGAEDGAAKLASEIEAIVFAHLDPTERLNASNFDELRKLKVERVERRRQDIQSRIESATRVSQAIHERRLTLDDKKAQKKALEEELIALTAQVSAGATDAEAKFAEDMAALQSALAEAQAKASNVKRRIVTLDDVAGRVEAFRREAARFLNEVSVSLKAVGLGEDEIGAFRPTFAGDPERMIDARKAAFATELAGIEGEGDPPAEGTIRATSAALDLLAKRQSDDHARRTLIQTAQVRMSEIRAQAQRLDTEIGQIETGDAAALEAARQDRLEAYLEHFDSLDQEARILDELYKPVRERLSHGRGNERQLEFEIRRRVDVEAWLERGEGLVDTRKTLDFGNIKRFEDFAAFAREALAPAWEAGDRELVKTAFALLLTEIRTRPQGDGSFMKKNRTYTDFLAWLHEVQHISLNYGLVYQKTPLEKLSPGTKGIVLLILYLAMVQNERRPLIVDQPEENLDNESIFADLAAYFREAKNHRQIILITHNPNLVVNTDAEQVVVAHCERGEDGLPSMRYVSGSLENAAPDEPDIRGQVCRILEGGAEAFRKRDERYRLG